MQIIDRQVPNQSLLTAVATHEGRALLTNTLERDVEYNSPSLDRALWSLPVDTDDISNVWNRHDAYNWTWTILKRANIVDIDERLSPQRAKLSSIGFHYGQPLAATALILGSTHNISMAQLWGPNQVMAGGGTPMTRYLAARAMYRNDGIANVKQLVAETGRKPNRIYDLLSSMEEAGLVEVPTRNRSLYTLQRTDYQPRRDANAATKGAYDYFQTYARGTLDDIADFYIKSNPEVYADLSQARQAAQKTMNRFVSQGIAESRRSTTATFNVKQYGLWRDVFSNFEIIEHGTGQDRANLRAKGQTIINDPQEVYKVLDRFQRPDQPWQMVTDDSLHT